MSHSEVGGKLRIAAHARMYMSVHNPGVGRFYGLELKRKWLSEIETLTGEDATERVEMALGQPITSREQIPERTQQERKLQNNVIIAP